MPPAMLAAIAARWALRRRGGSAGRRRPPVAATEILLYRVTGLADSQERFIGIFCGDLRRARCAEVWVNSENTDMQMARFNEFSVSSVIRYEGAVRDDTGRVVEDRIAEELARRLAGRTPVPPGTAILTGPGELRLHGVRRVAHVAAVQGEPGAGFRQIREVGRCVTSVLAEVDRTGDQPALTSVLFPLLGVGGGGGEPVPTIAAMTGAALDYFGATPGSSIDTVYLLAYTEAERAACRRFLGGHRRLRATAAVGRSLAGMPAGALAATAPEPPQPRSKVLRMGFVLDVVGYGARPAPVQEAVQERLFRLVGRVLTDCGIGQAEVDKEWSGDGANVFLPSGIDPTRALPDLVRAIAGRLAEDNHRDSDRLRLRMAVGVGVVGPGATGFSGSMVVDINRLVDSPPLRAAIADNPDADMAVLLSDHVHSYVVLPGYPGLPAAELSAVDVEVKEFRQPAWMWIAPPHSLDQG